jgi:hypothetical protein
MLFEAAVLHPAFDFDTSGINDDLLTWSFLRHSVARCNAFQVSTILKRFYEIDFESPNNKRLVSFYSEADKAQVSASSWNIQNMLIQTVTVDVPAYRNGATLILLQILPNVLVHFVTSYCYRLTSFAKT